MIRVSSLSKFGEVLSLRDMYLKNMKMDKETRKRAKKSLNKIQEEYIQKKNDENIVEYSKNIIHNQSKMEAERIREENLKKLNKK